VNYFLPGIGGRRRGGGGHGVSGGGLLHPQWGTHGKRADPVPSIILSLSKNHPERSKTETSQCKSHFFQEIRQDRRTQRSARKFSPCNPTHCLNKNSLQLSRHLARLPKQQYFISSIFRGGLLTTPGTKRRPYDVGFLPSFEKFFTHSRRPVFAWVQRWSRCPCARSGRRSSTFSRVSTRGFRSSFYFGLRNLRCILSSPSSVVKRVPHGPPRHQIRPGRTSADSSTTSLEGSEEIQLIIPNALIP